MLASYLIFGTVFALMLINAVKFCLDTKQKGSIGKIIKSHWHDYIWGMAAGALSAFGSVQLFHRVLGFDSFPALSTTIKGQPLSLTRPMR